MRAAMLFLLMLGTFLPAVVVAQPVAWSVNSDSDGVGSEPDPWQLLTIDLSTLETQIIGPTSFIDIEGLAFSPDGDLYGIDDATKTLIQIDTATGGANPVNGQLGNVDLSGPQDPAIVFDCSGQLWLATRGNSNLYRVDPSNGELNLIGDLGAPITALTATRQGLFGLGPQDAEGFYSIDRSSGRANRIGSLGLSHGYSGAGLSVDANGVFWGVLDQSSPNAEPSVLIRINPETGQATRVADTLMGLESLAFPHDQQCASSAGIARPVPSTSESGRWLLVLLMAMAGLSGLFVLRR